jgi:hypothetical protein
MPLSRNIDDPKFVKQLNMLDHRNQFIRELAIAILPDLAGFESVSSIANRVYDRHCSPQREPLNRSRLNRPARTALSA